MDVADGGHMDIPFRERISRSFMTIEKEYGFLGIVGAVIISLIPFIFSLVYMGRKKGRQRAVQIDAGGETGFTMRNSRFSSLIEVPWDGATTMAALFEQSCRKHAQHHFLGTRKLISREFVEAGGGRKFEKLHLGEYEWQTYGAAFDRACNFASGLAKLGHSMNSRAAIFSDTRAEWFIAAQGCFRQNIVVVTIYASLGEDALIHALNETQVSTLICDSNKLKKLEAISSSLESLENVVYFEDGPLDSSVSDNMSWTVLSFNEVERLGRENPAHPILPSSTDTAVIMYTSGSTGLPKETKGNAKEDDEDLLACATYKGDGMQR